MLIIMLLGIVKGNKTIVDPRKAKIMCFASEVSDVLALCRIVAPGNGEPKQERKITANGANDDGYESLS